MADTILHAAETGNRAAIRLMLDLGFPIDTRVGGDGGTILHAAAYSGSAEVVRLLLERGADIEGRDGRWRSTALEWAVIGSGEQPKTNPNADWVTTLRSLIDAGASTGAITLSEEDPKPPSQEIAPLLRGHITGREKLRS